MFNNNCSNCCLLPPGGATLGVHSVPDTRPSDLLFVSRWHLMAQTVVRLIPATAPILACSSPCVLSSHSWACTYSEGKCTWGTASKTQSTPLAGCTHSTTTTTHRPW